MSRPTDKTNMPPKGSVFIKHADYVLQHHDTYPAIDASKADLSGKSMLIAGASKGVGRMTAIRYAVAGCPKIAIAARSDLTEVERAVKEAAKANGRPEPQVLSLSMDVTSEDSVRSAAEAVEEAFGPSLDVLITNAGYLETWTPLTESDTKEWWRSWEVNIKGTYLTMRYLLPLVLKSETKTLVTLSSAGGHNTIPGGSAYQTSKFATCRLTEFADAEYGDQGLVAISLHPGGVKTELAFNMPEWLHHVLVDEPELPADVLVWLSRERREWLSGRFISACWDVNELEKKKGEITEKDALKFKMVF
ncbi:hypothetical protein DFH08DRAFT_840442 [Mycena albidolilacea]|uniref:Uncharacterized protein n=1 Tax=Mycena albidolilacea TaxID=1033008 RepID=A0AAD7AR98_9AGAR|nr:hypothetical protein DFH08DRAFT_840442 [Mycena albidolilacea]